MNKENSLHSSELHIIGLGGGGCNALENIYGHGVRARYTCISDPIRTYPTSKIDFFQFAPPIVTVDAPWWEYVQLCNIDQDLLIPEEILNLFFDDKHYVLLAAFGGCLGTLLTKGLYQWLDFLEKDYTILFSIPFAFEGKERLFFATLMKNELHIQKRVHYFHLDELRKDSPNMTLEEGFKKADEQFYDILLNVIDLN
jgi:cell division GTPase FtsZ